MTSELSGSAIFRTVVGVIAAIILGIRFGAAVGWATGLLVYTLQPFYPIDD